MPKLSWDTNRDYEVGVDRGIFFPQVGPGEAWNGLVSVDEAVSDLTKQIRYRDGVKTANRRSADSFAATIQAYTYPTSFPDHRLTQKRGAEFGFSYRVSTAGGYKIHLVYNATARMTNRSYTQSDTALFSFDISTRPIPIPGAKPSAHLVVDTSNAYSWTTTAFEEILYGTDAFDARLPLPEEVFEIFEVNSILRVTDHGDGTFTVTGPDEVIQMDDETTFRITWPSAVMIDGTSYTISSL